jgi:hypothetical protein
VPDSEMVEIFLSMLLTCADGKWILDGISSVEITSSQRGELIIEILQAMPDNCTDEQYEAGTR